MNVRSATSINERLLRAKSCRPNVLRCVGGGGHVIICILLQPIAYLPRPATQCMAMQLAGPLVCEQRANLSSHRSSHALITWAGGASPSAKARSCITNHTRLAFTVEETRAMQSQSMLVEKLHQRLDNGQTARMCSGQANYYDAEAASFLRRQRRKQLQQ